MDMSTPWLSELLVMEDEGIMNYDQMSRLISDPVDDFSVDSFSSDSYTDNVTFTDPSSQTRQPEMKLQEKTSSSTNKSCLTKELLINTTLATSNAFTISFGDLNPENEILYEAGGPTKVPITVRNTFQAKDHVLAERKRREKLNQNFVSLLSLLPNLKKEGRLVVKVLCRFGSPIDFVDKFVQSVESAY